MANKGTSKGSSRRRPAGSGGTGGSKTRTRRKSSGTSRSDGKRRRDDRPRGGGQGGGQGRGRPGGRRQGRSGPHSNGGGGNVRGGNFVNGVSHDENSMRTRGARTSSFEDLFAESGKAVKKIGLALRELIMSVLPDSEERVHLAWKIALYNEPMEVCGIQPVSKHCNLYFSNGARMNDPDGLLEGTGKSIRHVKVRDADDMPVEQLKSLIAEAKRVARSA